MSESCDICPLYPHAYDCPLPSDCGMPRQLSVTAHSLNHCSQYGSVHAIAVPMSDCLLFLMYLLFILHLSSSVLIHSSSFLLILSLCKDVASSRHSCSQGHRFSPCFLSLSLHIRLGLRTFVCSHTILPISYEHGAHRISIIIFITLARQRNFFN